MAQSGVRANRGNSAPARPLEPVGCFHCPTGSRGEARAAYTARLRVMQDLTFFAPLRRCHCHRCHWHCNIRAWHQAKHLWEHLQKLMTFKDSPALSGHTSCTGPMRSLSPFPSGTSLLESAASWLHLCRGGGGSSSCPLLILFPGSAFLRTGPGGLPSFRAHFAAASNFPPSAEAALYGGPGDAPPPPPIHRQQNSFCGCCLSCT